MEKVEKMKKNNEWTLIVTFVIIFACIIGAYLLYRKYQDNPETAKRKEAEDKLKENNIDIKLVQELERLQAELRYQATEEEVAGYNAYLLTKPSITDKIAYLKRFL